MCWVGYMKDRRCALEDVTVYKLPLIGQFIAEGSNVYTDELNSYNGIDETNGLYQGVDFGTYPATKTISFGASLTL